MGRIHDDDPYVGNTVITYLIDDREIQIVGWRNTTSPDYEWFDFYEGEQKLNSRTSLFRRLPPSFDEVKYFLNALSENEA